MAESGSESESGGSISLEETSEAVKEMYRQRGGCLMWTPPALLRTIREEEEEYLDMLEPEYTEGGEGVEGGEHGDDPMGTANNSATSPATGDTQADASHCMKVHAATTSKPPRTRRRRNSSPGAIPSRLHSLCIPVPAFNQSFTQIFTSKSLPGSHRILPICGLPSQTIAFHTSSLLVLTEYQPIVTF